MMTKILLFILTHTVDENDENVLVRLQERIIRGLLCYTKKYLQILFQTKNGQLK